MSESILTPAEQPAFTKAPKEPDYFWRALREMSGLSPSGLPMLRCVWSEQAIRWRNGKQVLAYPDERKQKLIGYDEYSGGQVKQHRGTAAPIFSPHSVLVVPIYDWEEKILVPHWVLEVWTPSEELAGWDVVQQGPFPDKGCYQIFLHIRNQGQYAPLNDDTLASVRYFWAKLLEDKISDPHFPNTPEIQEMRLQATREREAAEQELRDKSRRDDIQHAFMEDRHRLHDAVRADFG